VEDLFGEILSRENYCWSFFYIHTWSIIYFAADGLGMAVVRLVYIKNGTWLKYRFGEMKLLGIAGTGIVVISILLTSLYGTENTSKHSVYNMCTGQNQEFQVNILYHHSS
jgi:hypothetical protein